MAKKRRRQQQEEAPAENRRHVRLRARDRERNRRITMIVGGAVGLALLLIVIGAASELVLKPNSALAKVEDQTIVTKDFWKRARLRQSELQNQLFQLQAFSQQFGDSSLFASQISSINATLSSPLSLGTQVLNDMIEEEVLRQKAAELGVTITDEEVEQALREEVARGQGAVTESQATATAEAGIQATETAASFTPTPTASPTPELEGGSTVTDTVDAEPQEPPTPEPPTILTDELYQEGLKTLEENLQASAGMNLAEYREVVRARLLRSALEEKIGQEQVSATEEQVHVRHILISVDQAPPEEADPTPTPGAEAPAESSDDEAAPAEDAPAEEAPAATAPPAEEPQATAEPGEENPADEAAPSSDEAPAPEQTPEQPADAPEAPAAESSEAEAPVTDDSSGETTGGDEQASEPPATEETPDANGDGTVDETEALAFALMLRQRILDGEDFGDLAVQFSDDPGSGSQGGDLGWAGRGRYVPEFDEAAFTLPIGEISEPIKTTFGYHLIEVLERDTERPKDENTLQQEYTQAFQTWVQEQVQSMAITRPDDLESRLPRQLASSPVGQIPVRAP